MTGPPAKKSIVVLISGRGSNMLALIDGSRAAASPYFIDAVFSDRHDAPGIDAARTFGIEAAALPPHTGEDRAAYDARLSAAIGERNPALIVLAGFMRILSTQFVDAFPGKILNIHPSLLPKYPGLHTHRRALANGDREHGATVHFVTAQLDAGPAILQGRVRVEADDTEPVLAARVLKQEHRIYPRAVHWYCDGRLRYADGRAWLDDLELLEPVGCAGPEAALP